MCLDILENKGKDLYIMVVVVNVVSLLYLSYKVKDLKEGVSMILEYLKIKAFYAYL